jgi:hypothetical protein
MTVEQLIDGALRLIGVIAAGETPASADRDDGLTRLNSIIMSWNAEPNAISKATVSEIAMAGSASTTLSPRPLLVLSATAIYGGAVTQPVEVCSAQRWAEIAIDRAGLATFPRGVFCDYGSPTSTLYIGPRFTGTLHLITAIPVFTEFAALSDTVSLEAGYQNALQYALAVEFAPEFGARAIQAAVAIKPIADAAKASLGTLNQLRRAYAPPSAA